MAYKTIYILIIYFLLIINTNSLYYLSFDVYKADDCLFEIKYNDKIIYHREEECTKDSCSKPPINPNIFQIEYNFQDIINVTVLDYGGAGYIGIDTRINEYLIRPRLSKFWNCTNCFKDSNNLYNSKNDFFEFYKKDYIKYDRSHKNYFYLIFNIEYEEDLLKLDYIIEYDYYTLNDIKKNISYLNNLNEEITLIDFKDKDNFYITHNKSYIIPFDNIYFKLFIDENIKYDGKIMGYNFNTKKYEELHNNDSFQITDDYNSLKYKFSEKEKNNHGVHIKFYIKTYNSPNYLQYSHNVSNLGTYEYYFCEDDYNKCDSEFYLNCIHEFKCYKECPNKINNKNNECNYCHHDCETCDSFIDDDNNANCKTCLSDNKFLKFGNCVDKCKNGYYNDTNDLSIKKCKCDLDNCFICTQESLNNNNSCISCNNEKGYYPKFDEYQNNNENLFIQCYKSIDGYYLDSIYFKLCYNSCEKCDIGGNNSYHNCIECKSNYEYEIQYEKYKNCYINCSYYYYKNNNKYYCTKTPECSDIYNKLILGTRECIDDCTKISRYKFRNICYIECPEDTIISNEKPYYCEVICDAEKPFEMIEKQECVSSCDLNEMKEKKCIIKYKKENNEDDNGNNNNDDNEENNKVQDIILESIENSFISENYDTSNLENGEDDVIQNEKMTVTLTTSDNQKNNDNNNMSSIDLGECETLLRKAYKIPDDKKLYMKKIDVPIKGMKIPKIEYNVYCKLFDKNLIQLNLSVCENSRVDISVPVVISENLDKINSSSDYYNDLCYTVTSDTGTDISLRDRKKEFVENNVTVCQDNCKFSEYDTKTQKAKCSCKVKESTSSFGDININKENLYDNFVDIKNIANINILGCYNKLFSKNGIIKNIGCWILIVIIILHLICMILFYCKGIFFIKEKIEGITYAIQNWGLVKKEEKRLKRIRLMRKRKSKNKQKQINIINKNKNIDVKKENKENYIMTLPLFDYYYMNNHNVIPKFIGDNPPIKNKSGLQKELNQYKKNNDSVDKKDKSNKEILTTNDKNINRFSQNAQKKSVILKSKKIMEYDNEELNNLPYKLALKYDKRNYCSYYLSLIMTKHILIFSFFNNDDYNSKIIKIDLFILSFSIYYTVNALFFNDDTMHKIYEDNGSFNLEYQLPQIIYSSLISSFLNAILKLLALSEDVIINFKKDKSKKNLDQRTKKVNINIKMRILAFFIIAFIFLLFFWYYLSMFCVIYKNTQLHLIKDTLISFGLSFFYPLIIYLLPGIFRIPSLSNRKNKRNIMYNISKILQMIL